MTNIHRLWRHRLFPVTAVFALTLSVGGYFFIRPSAEKQPGATCRAPAASIIPADWRDQYLAPGNAYYESLFSDNARAAILSMPSAPVPPFFQGGTEQQLDLLGRGRLFVAKDKPEPLIHDIDWSVTKYGKYYATQLHSLIGIGSVLEQAKPMDGGIARSVSMLLRNWSLCVAGNPGINDRAWYEGTVIKRLALLLTVLNYMRKHGEFVDFSYENLIYLIDLHANYLLDTENVYVAGNHGIRQDLLLATTATHLPGHPRAAEMMRLAESRLSEAADTLFTADGIWKEHAPGYVHYVLRLMLDVRVVDDYNESFNAGKFIDRLFKSSDYLLKSLTPDMTIPWIGESGAVALNSSVRDSMVDMVGKSIDEQLSGLSNTVQVFKGYGHAIVRGQHPHGLYLIFVAAQNLPSGKRHADDLSFILYNHGRLWITEGGHENYERGDIGEYLLSPLAHNTYTTGDEYVEAHKLPELKTYIRSVETGAFGAELTGFTERFPVKASVQRKITVNPEFSALSIEDRLHAADNSGPWRGRLHFPSDLLIEIDGNVLTAKDPATGKNLVINFVADRPLHFQQYSADTEPVRGWGARDGKLGPLTTIEYGLDGDASITMTLSWNLTAGSVDSAARQVRR